ncbi:MAG: recombination protein NinG [Nitrosomonadaceae bacterium]
MPRCKICKVKFKSKYFLQKACVRPDCLAKWAKQDREAKAEIKHKEDKRRLKDNDKPLRDREAQKAFNAYIRARDSDLPCISCGRFHTGQYHAGHYKSRGAHPELRFNELNCHKQCSACNNHLSGNIANYRPMLLIKIGAEKLDWIEGPHEPKKYTCAELKEVELIYKGKIKELQ